MDDTNLKNYKKRDKEVEENMLDRHKRSASALRENLLKRKQQMRMLKEQEKPQPKNS